MTTLWLLIMALLVAGWVLVDGAVHGSAMTLRRFPPNHRRGVLTGIGPFLLAGEVWLVAIGGTLIGVFPGAEHDLFAVAYPVIVVLLTGWITRDAGIWFRSRLRSRRWRAWWEWAAGAGAVTVAGAWGLVCAALIEGLPAQRDGSPATLVGPYPLLWGAFMIAAFAAHGAAFTAARVPKEATPAARALIRPRVLAAGTSGAAVAVATPTLASGEVPSATLVLLLVAVGSFAAAGSVAAAKRKVTRTRHRSTLMMTGTGVVAAVVAVGVQAAPWLREGIVSDRTLGLLSAVLGPVVVVMVLVQLWTAWLFRHRVDDTSAVFY